MFLLIQTLILLALTMSQNIPNNLAGVQRLRVQTMLLQVRLYHVSISVYKQISQYYPVRHNLPTQIQLFRRSRVQPLFNISLLYSEQPIDILEPFIHKTRIASSGRVKKTLTPAEFAILCIILHALQRLISACFITTIIYILPVLQQVKNIRRIISRVYARFRELGTPILSVGSDQLMATILLCYLKTSVNSESIRESPIRPLLAPYAPCSLAYAPLLLLEDQLHS